MFVLSIHDETMFCYNGTKPGNPMQDLEFGMLCTVTLPSCWVTVYRYEIACKHIPTECWTTPLKHDLVLYGSQLINIWISS